MAFIIITDTEGHRIAVNVDNIRSVIDTDPSPTIVMIPSGHMAYNIKPRESFVQIIETLGHAAKGS